MGNGIAQVFASFGVETRLVDIEQAFVDRGLAAIGKSLDRFVKKEKISADERDAILARVTGSTAIDCVADAELVIEAVSENTAIKSKIFADLDRHAPADGILASNTSSISITLLGAATKRPSQVIGMHFMNPVPLMKLVEVICGQDTSEATTGKVMAWSEALGKTPVQAQDYPGFISNRVLMPMINEAAFCLMEGVSDREGIDEIMKLGMNCAAWLPPVTSGVRPVVASTTTVRASSQDCERPGLPMMSRDRNSRAMKVSY
jgi:3-hydroxybutyryl-CoA dehydrogenase